MTARGRHHRPTSWKRRIKALLLPPAGPLLAIAAGLLAAWAGAWTGGLVVASAGAVVAYALALPIVARPLLGRLDRHPPLAPEEAGGRGAGAIVVLDGGRQPAPPEHGGDTVQPLTLERLRHAARLHRATALPILVSGNGARELMAQSLEEDFGVAARWIEPDSDDTAENADRSARVLRAEGIATIVLVTHFWHMPRAVAAFRRAGLEPVPAPMGFADPVPMERGVMAFVPSLAMTVSSHLAVHELLGALWYRLRGKVG